MASKFIFCLLFLEQHIAQTSAAFTHHTTPMISIPTIEQGRSRYLPKQINSTPTSIRLKKNNNSDNGTTTTTDTKEKEILINYLSKVTPNQSTSKSLTDEILNAVSNLEPLCPTDIDSVLTELNGNWELIWTAQDTKGSPMVKVRNWINPLENQAYSINPLALDDDSNDDGSKDSSGVGNKSGMGRSNPLLPQNIQNKLEEIGLLVNSDDDDDGRSPKAGAVSNQAIDIRRGRVRNVVSVLVKNPIPFPNPGRKTVRGSLTVDVNFKANSADKRKIDVKFSECRVLLQNSPLDLRIPLGPIGPTGEYMTYRSSGCHCSC